MDDNEQTLPETDSAEPNSPGIPRETLLEMTIPDDVMSAWEQLGQTVDDPRQSLNTDPRLTDDPDDEASGILREESLTYAGESGYLMDEEIGKGGQGVVYRALQKSMGREVAVKFVKQNRDGTRAKTGRKKLIEEACVTGKLEHPNILPIYDLLTEQENSTFFSMRLLRDAGWKKWSEQLMSNSEEKNVDILLRVMDAVAFAHSRNVVHRDLKPENVMLGEYNAVFLVDWGMALDLPETADGPGTVKAKIGGSPAYMAPEMAAGKPIGIFTDVYLLGAVLFEIATGQVPHQGPAMPAMARAFQNEIAETAKTGPLVDLAMTAMATAPDERFSTVDLFQEKLKTWQEETQARGESRRLTDLASQSLVEARDHGLYERFQQALFGFRDALTLWPQNTTAIDGEAETVLHYAECAFAKRDHDLAFSLLDLENAAHRQLVEDESRRVAEHAESLCKMAADSQDYIRFHEAAERFQQALEIWPENPDVRARQAATVVDHARCALQRHDYDLGLTLLEERSLLLAEQDCGHEELQHELGRARKRMQFVRKSWPVGLGLIVALAVGFAIVSHILRDEAEAATLNATAAQEKTEGALLVARIEKLFAALAQVTAEVSQMNAEREQWKAESEKTKAENARVEADENAAEAEYASFTTRIGLAAAKIEENAFSEARTLLNRITPNQRAWEWHRLMHLCSLAERDIQVGTRVECAALSRDGNWFVVGGTNKLLRLYRSSSPAQPAASIDLPANATCLAAAIHRLPGENADTLLAVGTDDQQFGFLRVWKIEDGVEDKVQLTPFVLPQPVQPHVSHTDAVVSVQFRGSWMLTGSRDKTANLWELDARRFTTRRGHSGHVHAVAISPDQKHLATAGPAGEVFIWKPDDVAAPARMPDHGGDVFCLAFLDNERLVSGGSDRKLRIWNVAQAAHFDYKTLVPERPRSQPEFLGTKHAGAIRVIDVRRQNIQGATRTWLVIASDDATIQVWSDRGGDAPSGFAHVKTLRGHGGHVRGCGIFPAADDESMRILSAGHDQRVKIWDVDDYEEQRVLGPRGGEPVLSARFSGDAGRLPLIVSANHDDTATVWDMTGKRWADLVFGPPPSDAVHVRRQIGIRSAVFVPPHNDQLLVGALDRKAWLWDVPSGRLLHEFRDVAGRQSLAVSEDGTYVLAGSRQGRPTPQARLWRRDPVRRTWREVLPGKLTGWKGKMSVVAISPNDRRTGQPRCLFGGDDRGRCWLWDLQGKEIWQSRHHEPAITDAVFHELNGQLHLFTASRDHSVAVWNLSRSESPRRFMHSAAVTDLCLLRGRNLLAAACADGRVRLWDLNRMNDTRPPLVTTFVHSTKAGDPVNSVTATADESKLATVSSQTGVRIWDIDGRREIVARRLTAATADQYIWSAAFDPADRLVTVGGSVVQFWNAATRERVIGPPVGIGSADIRRLSETLARVATAGKDGVVRLWNVTKGRASLERTLRSYHQGAVNDVMFLNAARRETILTVSSDGRAVVYSPDADPAVVREFKHPGKVNRVRVSVDGQRIITAADDGYARVWELNGGGGPELYRHGDIVLDAAFSPDGTAVVTVGNDRRARIWLPGAAEPRVLSGHTARVTAVSYSPDGTRIITGSDDGTARIWDARSRANPVVDPTDKTEAELLTLSGHTSRVTSVAFSPDGKHVLTSSFDGKVVIWPSAALPRR